MSLKGTTHIVTDEERMMSVPEKLAKYYKEGMISQEKYEELIRDIPNTAYRKKSTKPPKSLRKIVLIILCVVFLISFVTIAIVYHNNAIEKAYNRGHLVGEGIGYKKGYAEGRELYTEIKDEYRFFHNYAVIVTSTGKKYHRYNCHHIKNRTFYIYNTSNAKAQGYTACLDCY